MELRRNQNPRHVYDVKRNPDIEEVQLKKPCQFGHSYEHYRRTCDVVKDVKIYDYAADKNHGGQEYPVLSQTKRRFPAFS